MEKTDPHTGELFISIRTNQKFASRKNQIAYNNVKQKVKKERKDKIDKILEKNRNLLLKMIGAKLRVIVPKETLKILEYNFGYYTHSCYDPEEQIKKTVITGLYEFLIGPEYASSSNYKILINENY